MHNSVGFSGQGMDSWPQINEPRELCVYIMCVCIEDCTRVIHCDKMKRPSYWNAYSELSNSFDNDLNDDDARVCLLEYCVCMSER